MGKYSYEFNVPVTYKYQLMQIIANELAEANRLKRLELGTKSGEIGSCYWTVNDLEDQA